MRGIVSLVHCRVHDCIMCLMVFMIIIDYCYQENFTLDTKMGCLFSRNELKIRIFDLTPAGDESEYLRPQGTITLTIDRKYNAPLMDIRFDGWYKIVWVFGQSIVNRESMSHFLRELHYWHQVLLHCLTVALILFFSFKNGILA